MAQLSRFLQAEIPRRGWSVEEFAHRSKISLSLAYQIVRDGRDNIRQDTLDKIASGLGMTPADVMSASGKGTAAGEIDARRQAVRDQLDHWLDAVGPAYEQYFWDDLKAHGNMTARFLEQFRTAVNDGTRAAVSAAVKRKPQRAAAPLPASKRTLRPRLLTPHGLFRRLMPELPAIASL